MPSRTVYRMMEARELRGVTVAELAEEVGVSTQAIYAYENGTTRPSALTLESISRALHFPISFFETQRQGITLGNEPIFFRSMQSTLSKQRKQARRWMQIVIDRVSYYEGLLELPAVDLPSFDVDIRSLDDRDVEDLAEQTRAHWKLGLSPISDVTTLLENHGFIITQLYFPCETLDAWSAIVNGRPYIYINTKKETCARVLMNLAHELAHLVLHSQVDEEQIKNPSILAIIEKQAKRFAGAFLMPAASFAMEVTHVSLDALITLKSRWRTSIASMIMRCNDLGIIDEEKKQYLFREYSRKKYRKFEPLDDVIRIEEPKTLMLCDEVLVTEIGKSKDQLLSDAKIYPDDYRVIINAPPDYFTLPKPQLRVLRS